MTSLTEGQAEFSLFLPMEDNTEYSIAAKANVSKLKTFEAYRLIDSVICHSACGPDSDGYGGRWWWSTSRVWYPRLAPFVLHALLQTAFSLHHRTNRSIVHQFLSAFVPLTPQWWQHRVCSFKWAFAHSLRITTTASVLPGLLSNWTAQRSLKKTSSSV